MHHGRVWMFGVIAVPPTERRTRSWTYRPEFNVVTTCVNAGNAMGYASPLPSSGPCYGIFRVVR
jgi:hypothetical protein